MDTKRRFLWLLLPLVAVGVIAALWIRGRAVPAQKPTDTGLPSARAGGIEMSPEVRERLGIRTEAVVEEPLTPIVRVSGTVGFDPKYVAAIGTRLAGFVRAVKRFEGDTVAAGELLAEIDSPELGGAQANVLAIRAQRRAAESNARREQALGARGLTTAREVEIAQAEESEQRSRLLAAEQLVAALGGAPVPEDRVRGIGVHPLRAPMAGTVVERHVSAGQSVEGHLTAFRVADLDHLWVELAVYERHLAQLAVGDRVQISPLSGATTEIEGRVAHVGEQIDPATRTAPVRVEIDNRSRALRPGQAVTANLHLASGAQRPAVVVPAEAITIVDGKPTVFVAESPTRFVVTPVVLGDAAEGKNEVVSGLAKGQQIVTTGVFALKSELFR